MMWEFVREFPTPPMEEVEDFGVRVAEILDELNVEPKEDLTQWDYAISVGSMRVDAPVLIVTDKRTEEMHLLVYDGKKQKVLVYGGREE